MISVEVRDSVDGMQFKTNRFRFSNLSQDQNIKQLISYDTQISTNSKESLRERSQFDNNPEKWMKDKIDRQAQSNIIFFPYLNKDFPCKTK